MSFSFNPLWKLLIDKRMTRESLRVALKLSPTTMAKMSKGGNITLEVLHKICEYFDVQLNEIIEYAPDEKSEDKKSFNL
jgi:putative transcriptional regulator